MDKARELEGFKDRANEVISEAENFINGKISRDRALENIAYKLIDWRKIHEENLRIHLQTNLEVPK